MSGLKSNITDKIWIDQYPDGSLFIIDDGNDYRTDRIRMSLTHTEMMKLIGTYLKEHSDWQESMEIE